MQQHQFLHLLLSNKKKQGFTLVELAIAIGISTVLASILGGTLLLASKSMPGKRILFLQNELTLIDVFHEDLSQSIACLEASTKQTILITHDQTGDGYPDRVTYAIASTGPPSVTRTLNQQQTHKIQTLSTWSFAHIIQKKSTSLPGETTWSDHISVSNLSVPYSGGDLLIERSKWYSFPLNPALPQDTLLWKPSKIGVALTPESSNGTVTISLNRFILENQTIESYKRIETLFSQSYETGSLPQNATYDPNDYDPDASDTYAWAISNINTDTPLQPGEKIQLQLSCPSSSSANQAAHTRIDLNSPGVNWVSTNDGETWSIGDSLSLIHEIHASIATPGTELSLTRPYLHSVHIYTDSTNSTHQLNSLNSPEKLEQYLAADLSQDPTGLDLNQDGQADWININSSAFDNQNLTKGFWQINGELKSQTIIFNAATTIDLSLLSQSSNGIELDLLFDQNNNTNQWANIKAKLSQQINGQELRINRINGSSESFCLTRATLESDQWIRLRTTILPNQKLIAFWANNLFLGTFAYNQDVTSTNSSGLTLSASDEHNYASNVSIRTTQAGVE